MRPRYFQVKQAKWMGLNTSVFAKHQGYHVNIVRNILHTCLREFLADFSSALLEITAKNTFWPSQDRLSSNY
jgi:hypothetical protein